MLRPVHTTGKIHIRANHPTFKVTKCKLRQLLCKNDAMLGKWNVLLTWPTQNCARQQNWRTWKSGEQTWKNFQRVFSHAVCHTVFELLAHDGACWCGDVVRGVLLGICRCDDGHQVVSVRRVDLRKMVHWLHCRKRSMSAQSTHQTKPVGQKSHLHTERHHKTKGTHPTGCITIHFLPTFFPHLHFSLTWCETGQSSNIVTWNVLPFQMWLFSYWWGCTAVSLICGLPQSFSNNWFAFFIFTIWFWCFPM